MAIPKINLPKKTNLLSTSSLFLKINENTKPRRKIKVPWLHKIDKPKKAETKDKKKEAQVEPKVASK